MGTSPDLTLRIILQGGICMKRQQRTWPNTTVFLWDFSSFIQRREPELENHYTYWHNMN